MTDAHPDAGPPFERVVCAVNRSDEAVRAALQGWLLAPDCPLTLVHVIDPQDAPDVPGAGPEWIHHRREEAAEMLESARRRLVALGVTSPITTAIEEGDPAEAFYFVSFGPERKLLTMGSGEEKEATVPLPPPTVDRMTRRILEAAACSVLVSRRTPGGPQFPAAMTVGFDGSEIAAHAYDVAAAVAARTGASLRVIMAGGSHRLTRQHDRPASRAVPVDATVPDTAEVALLKAGVESDLVVVGRRGMHGQRDLGSVSARVAAFSPVPVLVVHRPWAGSGH